MPAATVRVEDRIEHSRFVTTLARAESPSEARAFIDAVRAEFPDATHHCFAYVAGAPGSSAHAAASDAGEPAGTAGRPMLLVLLNSGVGEVVAVVTRWFGGVKLGKGGLVRAYSGGVQHALRELETLERVEQVRLAVEIPYAAIEPVRRAVARGGGRITAEQFGSGVTLDLLLPGDRRDAIVAAITDATSGAVRVLP